MSEVVIADTGPPAAAHLRIRARRNRVHSLRRHGCDTDPLLALIERGVLNIAFSVESELARLHQLMRRCRDQPMSLADACLVGLAGLHDKPRVWTFDSDFRVYRHL